MFRNVRIHAAFLAAALLIVPTVALAIDVSLTVRERDGVPRDGEIVTVGVPIAKGQLFSDQSAAISGTDGQFETLATWSDGSVRFLLCSFPATVPANGTAVFQLVNGAGDAAPGALNVAQAGGTVTVTTGPLRFTMKESGFNLFDEVWLDSNSDGTFSAAERIVSPRSSNGVFVEDRDGNVFTSVDATSYSLTLEEAGPLRAVVKFEGRVKGPAGEHVTTSGRVYAYRDRSDVKVQFMQAHMVPTNTTTGDQPKCRWREGFGNQGGSDNSFWIEELSLVTQLDLTGSKSYSLQGDPQTAVQSGAISDDAWMYQDSSGGPYWFVSEGTSFAGYELRHGTASLGSGAQAEGFADLSDGSRGLTVAIRHFWENFPNKLSVSPDGTVAVLPMPRDFSEAIEHRSGERKTHWALYYFHDGNASAAASEDVVGAFHHPLRAMASAQYYGETGVFDDFVPYDPVNYSDYEIHNEAAAWGWFGRRDDADFYGWQHFGDLWSDFEGGGLPPDTNKAANNMEGDTAYGMILQAVRTAGLNEDLSYAWWKLAEEGNVHTADIDIYHVMEGPLHWLWGGMWNHTAHGNSGYIDPHRGESPNAAHTWNRGMLYWYYLSGDRSVLDSALKVAENMTWRVENGPGMPGLSNTNGESRAPAYTLQIMLDTYMHTWDQRYLDAARRVVAESHFDTQGYASDYFSGDWATKPWMIGILMKSLGRFIAVSASETGTVEQEAISSILGYADFMEQRCYVDRNGNEPSYFHYKVWGDGTSTPGGMNVNMWTLRASDAFTWAYRYETDPVRKARWRQIAEHAYWDGSAYPWCFSCPRLEYTQAKVHQVVVASGQEWMLEITEGGGGSDAVPPAQITDLAASAAGNEVTLTWTAVGDDGNSGQALSYQVRRSATEISDGASWTAASVVSGAPIPGAAGTSESMTATGIPTGTWFFAVRAMDEALNLGVVSNSPSAVVGGGADTTPPARITDLVATTGSVEGQIQLAWTAPGDDGTTGTASSYEVRRSGSAITAGNWGSAIPVPGAPVPRSAGGAEAMTVGGMNGGEVWHFAVRALDEVPNAGEVSNSASAEAFGDTTPPVISDISVSETSPGTLTFAWTTNEPATSIVWWDDDFGQTGTLDNVIQDSLLKTSHELLVSGLSAGETIHYRIRSLDGAGNLGDTGTASIVISQNDSQPPVITNLGATPDGSGQVVVVLWITDELADSRVEWGLNTSYGNLEADPQLTLNHFVPLAGIAQGSTIHYRVRSTDGSGNEAVSGDRTFTFNVDTDAPIIVDTTMEVTPSQMRMTFETDEPSFGTFRWGMNPVPENNVPVATPSTPGMTHQVLMENLVYAVTYYWEIWLSDPSGNFTSDAGSFLFLGDQTLDTTPPVAPVGTRITSYEAGSGVVLLWEANAEVDLAGYNVYRREMGSSREALADWVPLNSNLVGETAYVDTGLRSDALYEYAVTAEDRSTNESGLSAAVFFNPELWTETSLLQPAFPNPFGSGAGTDIAFRAPAAGEGRRVGANLNVYDVSGRRVRTLFSGPLDWGESRVVRWDGTDGAGRRVAAGVYFYQLQVGTQTVADRKVVLLN